MSNETVPFSSTSMLQISDQFDHFQIRGHIAQGGMSDIYRAYDLLSGKEVALKIPDKSIIGDPAQYERFQREMEVVTGLNHPAVLRGLINSQVCVLNSQPEFLRCRDPVALVERVEKSLERQ